MAHPARRSGHRSKRSRKSTKNRYNPNNPRFTDVHGWSYLLTQPVKRAFDSVTFGQAWMQ